MNSHLGDKEGSEHLPTRIALLEAKVRLIAITLKSVIAGIAGAIVAYLNAKFT